MLGYKVLLGDTDSLFVLLKTSDVEKESEELRNKLEIHIRNYIKDTWKNIKNIAFNVDIDKMNKAIILFGIKKRYHTPDEMKGIEAVRKDVADLTVKMEIDVGNMMLEGEKKNKIIDYVKNNINLMINKAMPLNMIMVKGKCSKEKYDNENRNLKAMICGNALFKSNIEVGERFYWIYVKPTTEKIPSISKKLSGTTKVDVVASEGPSIPRHYLNKIDWERMTKYTILSPLKKYMELLNVDIQKLYNESKIEYDVKHKQSLNCYM